MKKTLSIILSICMLLSITAGLNLTAFADLPTSGSCGDNVTYTFNKNTGTLTISGTGKMYDFVLPYEQGVKTPFSYNNEITSVVIENGVTYIGNNTFNWCEEIESVDLSDSVTAIGEGAFYCCEKLSSIDLKNITDLGESSFWVSSSLKSVTLSDKLTDIKKDTFSGSGLVNVTIPKNVKRIEEAAFANCSDMVSITLPQGLTSIEEHAFDGCTVLDNLVIPGSVLKIGSYAFYRCEGLKTITINKGIESIGGSAFSASGITKIVLPNSIKALDNAFDGSSITDIYYNGKKEEWSKIDLRVIGPFTQTVHCSNGIYTEDENPSENNNDNNTDSNTDTNTEEDSEYTVTLSQETYTYNRKVKRPAVTVTYKDGTVLTENTDYTLTYAKGRKYAGKYAVTVDFIGDYSGNESQTLYFTIKPKGTSIKRLYRLRRGFKVNWKKQSIQTSGYQIQYSRYKSFKKPKTVTVKGARKTLRSIRKLTRKKTYYVRIRTYKTVNGEKIYSSWSKAKKVKTK